MALPTILYCTVIGITRKENSILMRDKQIHKYTILDKKNDLKAKLIKYSCSKKGLREMSRNVFDKLYLKTMELTYANSSKNY